MDPVLNVIFGDVSDRVVSNQLAETLEQALTEGTLFLGFPVISNVDETIAMDALLVNQSAGVVAFLLNGNRPETQEGWTQLAEEQNAAYLMLNTHLGRTASLRKGRGLVVTVNTLTVFPDDSSLREIEGAVFVGLTRIEEALSTFDSINPEVETALHSALQRIPGARGHKSREQAQNPNSKGWKLKEIGRQITSMDQWQKAAAIESPAGPQRIRGLAGSGKTVVIAHKAAYLHTRNPEIRIAVTFHTRSLYQQIEGLIDNFVFDNWTQARDPEKLEVLHAWGSFREAGIYSKIAASIGFPIRTFSSAVQTFGYDNAFQGACNELLEECQSRKSKMESLFDVVLIDEAQDLPAEFFRLVYLVTSEPKRIIWAYDEFQKLSDEGMLNTKDLFGTDERGQALVNIDNPTRGPRRDIVLPTCYRNTPWALVTAHALGMAIYSEGGLVNYPDSNQTWRDIGYTPVRGELVPNSDVTLERSEDSIPEYFSRLITPDDGVVFRGFVTENEHDTWIASEIKAYLTNDEVRPDDFLIVLPVALVWKGRAVAIRRALDAQGVRAHLVGVDNDVNEIHVRGSVAIAHVHRAKGNEAPIVFAVDSHLAAGRKNNKALRNALFTAITRSRGWVRVTGYGPNWDKLSLEAKEVVEHDYQLSFKVPDDDAIQVIRSIPGELNRTQEEAAAKVAASARDMIELIRKHNLDLDQLDLDKASRDLIRDLQD